MRPVPFLSLAVAIVFAFLAWKRRGNFPSRPYLHWFVYLNLAAVGIHQFEEYGWPGGFRDALAAVFPFAQADALVPTTLSLELLNAFGFTTLFGVLGWIGTRRTWIGLTVLFLNLSNGFFHLVYSVTRMSYVPGTVSGTVLYMPLAILAARHAAKHDDITAARLLLAFFLGALASFAPFLHLWLMYTLQAR